jgi:hypothetical protein
VIGCRFRVAPVARLEENPLVSSQRVLAFLQFDGSICGEKT